MALDSRANDVQNSAIIRRIHLSPRNNSIQSLRERIEAVLFRLNKATEKSGRASGAVRVVAVTKTVPPERIQEALDSGLKEIGENRVQEAVAKRPQLKGPFSFHLIGQLQRNKARKAVELFDLIQSIDSDRLAETVDRIAGEAGKKQRCLIEVKIANEVAKTGVPLEDAPDFIASFRRWSNLSLEGLMTIGPLEARPDDLKRLYGDVSALFQRHRDRFGKEPILSMGMSDDFETAVEAGSTMVRLGRVLFGERVK